jgi:hypothetical protein
LKDIAEGGMTWEEQQKVRRWAAQIYFVASQEMLHLALVWNLTTAIGGRPTTSVQISPGQNTIDPRPVPLSLRTRSLPASSSTNIQNAARRDLKSLPRLPATMRRNRFQFNRRIIRADRVGFERSMRQTFHRFANSADTRTRSLSRSRPLSTGSVIKAIEEITEQGEGRDISGRLTLWCICGDSRSNGFAGAGFRFSPARPAMRNPSAGNLRGYGANANPIENPLAGQVAALFDLSIA